MCDNSSKKISFPLTTTKKKQVPIHYLRNTNTTLCMAYFKETSAICPIIKASPHLCVPYFWYVRTKTREKIMCDENIKSPQPYITPRGTAHKNPNERTEKGHFLPKEIGKSIVATHSWLIALQVHSLDEAAWQALNPVRPSFDRNASIFSTRQICSLSI